MFDHINVGTKKLLFVFSYLSLAHQPVHKQEVQILLLKTSIYYDSLRPWRLFQTAGVNVTSKCQVEREL